MGTKSRTIIWLTMALLFFHASLAFGDKLSLPVELSIENGDFKNCIVSISKNGVVLESISGKSFLRIKLDFNNTYLLAFSKPSYITKKIEVNTTVNPQRQLQLFEPYKIGVKLFKQYEGINTVVYNQPVAKIQFNSIIDDFDYDVDYTKSILSKLQNTEQELESRAIEERRLINTGELPADGFEIKSSSSERFAQFPKITRAKSLNGVNSSKVDTSYQIFPSEDPVETAILNGGTDPSNSPAVNEGNDTPLVNGVNGSDEGKLTTSTAKGTDKMEGSLNTDAGQDGMRTLSGVDNYDVKPNEMLESVADFSAINTVSPTAGDDGGKLPEVTPESLTTKTKELTIEPNRTITTIKLNEGQNAVIYRKVLYNWGGLYYFKNLSYSISKDIFEIGTGEK